MSKALKQAYYDVVEYFEVNNNRDESRLQEVLDNLRFEYAEDVNDDNLTDAFNDLDLEEQLEIVEKMV